MRKLALVLVVANLGLASWYWLLPSLTSSRPAQYVEIKSVSDELQVSGAQFGGYQGVTSEAHLPAMADIQALDRAENVSMPAEEAVNVEGSVSQTRVEQQNLEGVLEEQLVAQLRQAQQRLQSSPEVTASPRQPTVAQRTTGALQGQCVLLEGGEQDISELTQYWQSLSLVSLASEEEQLLSELHWVVDQSASSRAEAQAISIRALELWQDAALTSGFNNPNSVSLGVFSSMNNARSRHQAAISSGFQAEIISRSRTLKRYQLLVSSRDWQSRGQEVRRRWPDINFTNRRC